MTVRRLGTCIQCGACCTLLALPIPRPSAWRRVEDEVLVARPQDISLSYEHFLTTRGCTIHPTHISVPVAATDPVSARVATYQSRLVLDVRSRCPQLQDDNLCRIHDTDQLPEACHTFPRVPADLDVLPDCSYRFEA